MHVSEKQHMPAANEAYQSMKGSSLKAGDLAHEDPDWRLFSALTSPAALALTGTGALGIRLRAEDKRVFVNMSLLYANCSRASTSAGKQMSSIPQFRSQKVGFI
jgi:hypothetical protein